MKEKVGFIGLGIMGMPMAANIARAGYPVTVYNRTPGKADALREQGIQAAASPRSLAESCDVIIVMVTGPEAINDLLWGKDGAAQAFTEHKVFVNMSSVSPMYTRELGEKLRATRVAFVDAPVSGSKKPAEDATLLILAGGLQAHVGRVTPILEAMGKKVIFCGEVGQGSMMKMAINLLLGVMVEGMAEVLSFSEQGGLPLEAVLDVISSGPLNCGIFQMKTNMFRTGEFPPHFPLKHMTKDLKFVVDTAYDMGAPIPAGHAMLQTYSLGVAQELGDLDVAAVYKVFDLLKGKKR